MTESSNITSTYDPLLSIDVDAELETLLDMQIEIPSADPLAISETTTPEADPIVTLSVSEADPLAIVEAPETILETPAVTIRKKHSLITDFTKEFGRYIAISSLVFVALLVGTNFSAYTSIAWNWVSPDSLKTSSAAISDTLLKSKITVFANEMESGATDLDKQKEAEDIKKKLEEENIAVKENIFSPKKLIPTMPSIQVDLDVMPYENRIIIPKLGKNIPLVDVEHQNNFDFDHMENIFMQELEKGVIRYPGTALPGENGNAFIFGHSSNYPWVKGAYNEVFALLDNLENGDQIIVYYNQKKYTYVINTKKIVRPTDVKAISHDDTKKELSLMTCWPVGTTLKRMIVSAELKEETSAK